MARNKGKTAPSTLTDQDAETTRIQALADRRRKALQDLAEVRGMEKDLGIPLQGEDPEGSENGNDGAGNGGGPTDSDGAALGVLTGRVPGEGFPIGDPDAPHSPSMPERDNLAAILGQLTEQGGKFEVFKVVNGEDMKLGMFPISDWEEGARLDRIAKEHGGGEFRVKFKWSNGLYAKQVTRLYDPKAYRADSPSGSGPLDPLAATAPFLTMLERREEAHRKELSELRAGMMAMQQTFMTAQLQMIQAQAAGGGNGQLIKSVQDLALFKELMGKEEKKSPMQDIKEVLEMVSMLKESPIAEPQTPLMAALDKAFLILKPLVEVGAAKLAQVPAMTPQPRVNQAAQVPPPTPAPLGLPAPASAVPQIDPQLKQYAGTLLAACEQGQDPANIAAFIVNSAGEEDIKALGETIKDPGLMGKFLEAEPKLISAERQRWLAEMLGHIKQLVEEALTPEAEPQTLIAAQVEPQVTEPAPAPGAAPEPSTGTGQVEVVQA